MQPVTVTTTHGDARAHVWPADAPVGALVLGHGAGGGVTAPDLTAAARAAADTGLRVVLVEQPYRVAGRRAPPRAPVLDAAWTEVVAALRADGPAGLPLVVGGRSSGARVACRTAAGTGAAGVLCLAFPLQPAARAGRDPAPSRLPELDAVDVPVLVVQGDRDPFGMPPAAARREVVVLPGDHALRRETAALGAAVRGWLRSLPGLVEPVARR
ncbi:alpha/beta hydrolase family protein [Cellulomonas aerilata]|uniref:alpha/beta hydrolase family protein n=1 Tax=Cellulomonas aerilata TaxID=515326 RepID=UPI0011BDFF23|nr:alpha/beta family hydrolase [Cellulomonas aerilata]